MESSQTNEPPPICCADRGREILTLGVGDRRPALLTRAAIGDAAKRFRLRTGSWMAQKSGEDCLRCRRRTHARIDRDTLAVRKETAPGGLQSRTRRRFGLSRHLCAMMFPITPAASRKFRIRILREYHGTDQREAEESHQQDCRNAAHFDDHGTSTLASHAYGSKRQS